MRLFEYSDNTNNGKWWNPGLSWRDLHYEWGICPLSQWLSSGLQKSNILITWKYFNPTPWGRGVATRNFTSPPGACGACSSFRVTIYRNISPKITTGIKVVVLTSHEDKLIFRSRGWRQPWRFCFLRLNTVYRSNKLKQLTIGSRWADQDHYICFIKISY